LAVTEDFFDQDVEVLAARSRTGPSDEVMEAAYVLGWIAQAIDVVEPKSMQLALRNQSRHEAVHLLEGSGMFRAQTREVVDVEEAPVIDGGESHAPIGEMIALPLEQSMQQQPAGVVF